MLIRSLKASFGCLENRELTLKPGLNIISAPNESGKSTWCAFLRCMLYGVDSARRSRAGELPDKQRYAPWSGAPMEGRMELQWQGREISLSRGTSLPALPMRDFSAVDRENGSAVPELHAEDAGELLTGCSEGVFERTAFIHGPLLRVENTGELEGRIASILAAPSGDASFPEASEKLREWQRKRSFRGHGRITELDDEIERLRSANEEWESCRREAETLEAECREAESQWEALRSRYHVNLRQELAAAREQSARLEQKAAGAEQRASEEREMLRSSPFAQRNAVVKAEAVIRDTETLLGQRDDWRLLIPGGLFGIFALAALWWNTTAALLLAGVSLLLFGLVFRAGQKRKKDRAKAMRLLTPFGASSSEDLKQKLWDFRTAAERYKRDSGYAVTAREEADIAAAELGELEQLAMDGNGEAELLAAETRVLELREKRDRSRGRLETLSGGDDLQQRREALLTERRDAQRQYDAITLALSELEKANEELRRRYSPALSELTESYFRKLTGGKYSEVLLDRELSALLMPEGGTLRRESAFLSRGAQDQLFLALRLALCTLLLGGEEKCPIVLDDALLSFDDERLGCALSLLEELGRERQILLFTCTDREERFLRRGKEDSML